MVSSTTDQLIELDCWSDDFVSLSDGQAAELNRSKLVELRPAGAQWQVTADSRAGVASGSGWELRVRPRLSIPRLFFLLAYAADPKGWRDQMAHFQAEQDLMDSVASGFALNALKALEHGILRGYVSVDERLTTIRGRIRFGDQISRNITLPLPAELTFDEFTEDIVENQLIATAALLLLRLPRVPLLARKRLEKVCGLLSEVTPIARPREASVPLITRLNQRYEGIMRLAELILHASSYDAGRGRVVGSAFVFDINKVFEDFVTVALTEATRDSGYDVCPQRHDNWLDHEHRIRIIPDVTWWKEDCCCGIVDAKYKALEMRTMPNADAYQMLAYCTRLALDRGYLVYAKEATAELASHHSVINSDAVIHVRTLNVELIPEELLTQVRLLGSEILRTGPSLSTAAC